MGFLKNRKTGRLLIYYVIIKELKSGQKRNYLKDQNQINADIVVSKMLLSRKLVVCNLRKEKEGKIC